MDATHTRKDRRFRRGGSYRPYPEIERVIVSADRILADPAASSQLPERHRLVLKWLRFGLRYAWSSAGKFRQSHYDMDDLFQESAVALLRACDGFDPARGAYGTYGSRCLVSQFCNLTRSKNRRFQSSMLNVGCNTIVPGLDGEGLEETIADYRDDRPGAAIDLQCAAAAIAVSIELLPERERLIFLQQLDGKCLREIGESLGLSRERVRQLGDKARKRVGAKLEQHGMRALVE